jgi:DNA-binding IclR family transcriptional regulator
MDTFNDGRAASERGSDAQAGVESVETGIRMLLALARLGGPQTLTALAAACGLPPPRAHRYLVSLVRSGVVERDASRGYRLGPAALEIGATALSSIDALQVASEGMVELRDKLNQAVALMVWGRDGPIIVRAEDSHRPVSLRFRIGQVLPVLSSASGMLLAAHLPWEKVRPVIESELDCAAVHGTGEVTSLEAVRAALSGVRQRGLSRVTGTLTPRVVAFAGPVFDGSGNLALSLSVVAPAGDFDTDWGSEVASALAATCAAVSRRLGHKYDIHSRESQQEL